MTTLPILFLRATFLAGTLLSLSACVWAPPVYFTATVRAQVIDEGTGQPIEKAIVVAQWKLFEVGFGDSGHRGRRLRIYETVTDANGYFVIPASGPLWRPPLTKLTKDPDLAIFKRGYMPVTYGNEAERNSPLRRSEWQDQPLKLWHWVKPPTLAEEAFVFSTFFGSIRNLDDQNDWRHYPRMLLAMSEEEKRLLAKGASVWAVPSVPDIHDFSQADQQFLENLKHEL